MKNIEDLSKFNTRKHYSTNGIYTTVYNLESLKGDRRAFFLILVEILLKIYINVSVLLIKRSYTVQILITKVNFDFQCFNIIF